MNRKSTTALIAYGMIIGLLASGLTALTRTGIFGLYGFGLLGVLIVGTVLMWPERNRFFMDKANSSRESSQSRDRRPRAL
jgi:hypothetical protein